MRLTPSFLFLLMSVSTGFIVGTPLRGNPAAAPLTQTHPFSVHDMLAMNRLSDPQVSPDGRWIVFVLRETDLEANCGRTNLWLVRTDGTGLRRLTSHPQNDSNPRWSSDANSVWFLSTRSESSQVWRIRIDGGEAEQVTNQLLDVGNLLVSPDGKYLAFTMEVFPDCNAASTKARLDEIKDKKSTGRIYDKIFVRHWDSWKDGRRSHLFIMSMEKSVRPSSFVSRQSSFDSRGTMEARPPAARDGRGTQQPWTNEVIDVMCGMDADTPSKPFGGPEEITFTPDGKGLIFTARDLGREEPWSTDFDLYWVPVDGSQPPKRLTEENKAWDSHPIFSPDGGTLAYLAMARPGYESDRFRIVLRPWPNGKQRILTENWDRSPSSICFSADGKTLYATAANTGQKSLFAINVKTGAVQTIVKEGSVSSLGIAADRIIYGLNNLRCPVELYSVSPLVSALVSAKARAVAGKARAVAGKADMINPATGRPDGSDICKITNINSEKIAAVRMGEYEQFTFSGWNNETVCCYVVKPVDFDPGKKYPVAFLIHGGPQGSFGNTFHYRWNPQVYAGAGYAAVMVDFHGSTGYGQAFTDSIRGDWGGKPLEDLQKGLAAALECYPWMDGDRVGALGGSFGGYMINWIAGNWPAEGQPDQDPPSAGRFRCLVNHDGNFDERMAYFDTDELWFPEWDHLGTPWDNPAGYEKHNPVNFVKNWKTPMLVIHGALDFRVADTQGLSTFTALQRLGIDSKLLYFPDENHWVQKPANSILWHETVLGWLDKWLKPAEGR